MDIFGQRGYAMCLSLVFTIQTQFLLGFGEDGIWEKRFDIFSWNSSIKF